MRLEPWMRRFDDCPEPEQRKVEVKNFLNNFWAGFITGFLVMLLFCGE